MNVDIRRTTGELAFILEEDPADASVPISKVWFRHDRVDQIGSCRISLMAYLLAQSFVGNSFTLIGLSIPAHLASRLHQDFPAHEFFVGPVNNVPEKILPAFKYAALEFSGSAGTEVRDETSAPLVGRRHELGYTLETHNGSPVMNVATNVDLFATFTDQPALLARALIYLCVLDVLGIEKLRVQEPEGESEWLSRLDLLLSEAGGGIDFDRAVS